MGESLGLIWTVPFAGILLSIGLGPLLTPHLWHHHFQKISIGWAALFAVPFLAVHGADAYHEIAHIYVIDYVPFIILLGSLFTISGGILVRGTLVGTPWTNAGLILIGTLLASWIGTTGASMLLIRPLLRANQRRATKTHTLVFFIFLVSNIGGALTPLGDPPLFLGFLHHVPFFWTLQNLWFHMLVAVAILMSLYLALDLYCYRHESEEAKRMPENPEPVRVEGLRNFALLGGVIAGVLLSGYWNPNHLNAGHWLRDGALVVLDNAHESPTNEDHADAGAHADAATEPSAEAHGAHAGLVVPLQNVARDLILVTMAVVSLLITPRRIREANGFTWFPIKEVAWLFAGIFMTIIPALKILSAGEQGALAPLMRLVDTPTHYFWVTGVLSSFLDNAPTYLTFLNTALGRFAPGIAETPAVADLIANHNDYLIAISLGAVFMGANTYIGNAPNFMVKSIAEEAGVKMPDFFRYIYQYSLPILIPTFLVIALFLL